MVVNVKTGDERNNLSQLLDWLNDTLQATFSQVEHTCSGIFVSWLIKIGYFNWIYQLCWDWLLVANFFLYEVDFEL